VQALHLLCRRLPHDRELSSQSKALSLHQTLTSHEHQPGLILVGQALNKQLSVGAVVMGWGMYVVGVMISSVGVTAYILDTFPSASGEVSSIVNLSRTISVSPRLLMQSNLQERLSDHRNSQGFSVGYYQMEWGAKDGFDVSFGSELT
jgi:hypothetical protein